MHQPIRESKISNMNEKGYIQSTHEVSNVDDWSSKLIGLSQFRRIPAAIRDDCDPFKAVPKIAVVPPTPDGQSCTVRRMHWEQMSSEQSPDDSPQDELPYRALNTSLKRYGTMSSLEKLPSDEIDDKTYDSSGAEMIDDDGECIFSFLEAFLVWLEFLTGIREFFNKITEYSGFLRAFVDSRELLEFFW